MFNHANYGSYVVNESSPQYGQPSFNANVAYQPRMLQRSASARRSEL